MNKILVFAADFYYPGGGLEDLIDMVDTLEQAQASVSSVDVEKTGGMDYGTISYKGQAYDWLNIFDGEFKYSLHPQEGWRKEKVNVPTV